jgi:hypothetical protein
MSIAAITSSADRNHAAPLAGERALDIGIGDRAPDALRRKSAVCGASAYETFQLVSQ